MPSPRRSVARIVAGLLAGAGAGACGPSFQAIYEGNARFEHCYALEENPQSYMRQKSDCWRDWSERYTYGQTRDRIQYAIARYVALSQAPNAPTDEAMMMAAPGMTPRVSTITAPGPTSAWAPPPKVLGEIDSGVPMRPSEVPVVVGASELARAPTITDPTASSSSAPSASDLPATECGERCGIAFRECSSGPTRDAGSNGAKKGPSSGCETTYRACMRSCFR